MKGHVEDKKGEPLDSPNIRSETDESLDFSSPEEDQYDNPAVDGIPIDEKDIKYHAKDIKKKDDSKLFVKVEGAKRIAHQKQLAEKKKDQELTHRLLSIAEERRKHNRKVKNEQKAVKRKYTIEKHRNRTVKVLKQVWRFRFAILALIIIISAAIVYVGIIIPARIAQEEANKQAAAAKFIEDHTTEMIKVYADLAGKELKKAELIDFINKQDNDMGIDFYDTAGMIFHKNGNTEIIRFNFKNNIASQFSFINNLDSGRATIYGAGNLYYYAYNETFVESDNVNKLVDRYIYDVNQEQE